MSEESPKDLDKLFQQEPEQYPFDYNEASWQEMEKLLDKDDRRRFLWWWFFGIGALILIGSIFFFGKNETGVVDTNLDLDKKEIVENQNQNQNQESNSNLENQTTTSDSENQIFKSEKSDENFQLNLDNISNKKELNNSSSTSNKNLQQYNYKNQNEDQSLTFDDFEFQKSELENTIVSDSVSEKTNEVSDGFLLKNNQKNNSVNVLLQVDSVLSISRLEILAKRENDIKLNLLERDTNRSSPRMEFVLLGYVNEKILNLALVLGSESSATNYNNFSKPNWKFGAQVEYRFLKKYSLSVGANFARKKYGAAGDDYNPEDGAWLYGVSPTDVDAVCDILELPVSISFFQYENNENGLYARLGMSSFFMLEEHYWYSYDQEIPGQIKYWGGENENKHWFGIGEVAFGYQHYLRPKTSVQIEPFFQIPLSGVGNGNVKLWSAGINLRLNFQVNKELIKYN
ncbi:MAG: hypothetical protein AB8H03_08640 [Saprospiraceae bacterium]